MKYLTIPLLLVCQIAMSQSIQNTFENYSRLAGEKKWKAAQKSIDSLLALEPLNNYWLMSKAEVEAELGNGNIAIKYLEKSIKNGFVYLEEIRNDDHLRSLYVNPQFTRLLGDLETQLSSYKLSEKDQQITIDVPPLMECYVIMLYLGNPNHTLINSKQNHSYFRNIDTYFAHFKKSKYVAELAKKYPSDESEWINNLRAHHNLRTLYIYDSLNIDEIKRFPIELDRELAKLVRDFAIETDFMNFYAENQEFYAAMKSIMTTNYSFGSSVIPFFNDNFEMRINRFNIYFSPIYGGWQHGPVAKSGNYIECFYFGGIMYSDTKEFYYPDVNLLFTFLTEFDHTPINALTKDFKNEIEELKEKVTILNTSGKVSYGSMVSTVEEYITWAFALQYFYEHTPSEYPNLEKNTIYAMEKWRGFTKFSEFMTFYKTYIDNRDKYPLLKDFYPEIIDWISKQ